MDERPKQLIGESRIPLPVEAGKPACFDTEYVRRRLSADRKNHFDDGQSEYP
jgi:hypothetical protein